MKRTLILALAATAMLTGCNQDEIVDRNPEGAITFENAFVDAETRTGELNTGNLAKFYVSGVIKTTDRSEYGKVFDNQEVTKSGSAWTYTPPKFWFNGTYDFYAFSHSEPLKAVSAFPASAADFKAQFKTEFDNGAYTGNEDFIYAKANDIVATEARTEAVALTFKHALARIKFSFKNSLGNDLYTIKIKDISTNAFIQKGDFSFSSETWSNTSGTFSPAFAAAETINNAATISSNVIYLIPETATSITFTAEIYNDGKLVKTHTFTSTLNTPLAKSTSYNFTAEIKQENLKLNQIDFTAEVDAWGADQEETVTLPKNN